MATGDWRFNAQSQSSLSGGVVFSPESCSPTVRSPGSPKKLKLCLILFTPCFKKEAPFVFFCAFCGSIKSLAVRQSSIQQSSVRGPESLSESG